MFYSLRNSIHIINSNTYSACLKNGLVEFCNILSKYDNKDIKQNKYILIFKYACEYGYFNYAKYLYYNNENIFTNSSLCMSFCIACKFKNIEIAQWIFNETLHIKKINTN